MVLCQPWHKSKTLFEKITKAKKTEGKVQVIESTCLVQALVRTKSKNLE
jgi:hypothetical protein